jgi:predicted DCC family thiol-disulfide oxidoreductase YuxK
MDHSIVLFDGVCNFCNASVNFIIDRDPAGRLRFAPLQSALGQELLRKFRLPPDRVDTVVLVDGSRCYTESSAALQIAGRLRWPWPLWCALLLVPPFLRDWAYEAFAANRYRWFGKADACRLPTPEVRARFVG